MYLWTKRTNGWKFLAINFETAEREWLWWFPGDEQSKAKVKEFHLKAHKFMEERKLYRMGWTFSILWSRPGRNVGRCNAGTRQIQVRGWHVLNEDPAEVWDTFLHEVAHALAYEISGKIGHDETFRGMCEILGVRYTSRKVRKHG